MTERPYAPPPSGRVTAFEVDPERKRRLLEGLDDISLTLQGADAIRTHEARLRREKPWLF